MFVHGVELMKYKQEDEYSLTLKNLIETIIMPFWKSRADSDVQSKASSNTSPNMEPGNLELGSVDGKRHFPFPSGPHPVGFVDILTAGKTPDGSFMRLLYPTKENTLHHFRRWPSWKDDNYITGMLNFMKAMTAKWPSWAPNTEYYALSFAGILTSVFPSSYFCRAYKYFNGQVYIPIIERAVPNTTEKYPLVVFSHGLGCTRSSYSRICYEIASHGFMVVAVEHREGSACYSYYMNDVNDQTDPKPIPHRKLRSDEDEYEVRHEQLRIRRQEVSKALDLILNLSEKENFHNLLTSSRDGLLLQLAPVIDKETPPTIIGHSFGGATTILSLMEDPRFHNGIILDPWVFPLRDVDLKGKIKKPLLCISTDSFRSEENLKKLSELMSEDPNKEYFQSFDFIKGSVHQNHVDTAFVCADTKPFIKKCLGLESETCPNIVQELTTKKVVQFIRDHLNLPPDEKLIKEIENHEHLLEDLFK